MERGIHETSLNAARRGVSTNQKRAGCLSLKLPDLLAAAAAQSAFTSLPPLPPGLTQAGRLRGSLQFPPSFFFIVFNIFTFAIAEPFPVTIVHPPPRRTARTSSRTSNRHHPRSTFSFFFSFDFFFSFGRVIDCFDQSGLCPAATSPWMFARPEQNSVTDRRYVVPRAACLRTRKLTNRGSFTRTCSRAGCGTNSVQY